MEPDGFCNSGIALADSLVRPARLLSRIRDERGVVSANELLVAVPIMLAVLFAVFILYNQGVKGQTRTENRVQSLQQQQVGMEKMQRELRQAVSVTPTSSQTIDMDTYVGNGSGAAQLRHVRYSCTDGSCKRYEGNVGSVNFSSGPVPTITGVLNSNVFGMEPDFINPNFIALRVEVRIDDQQKPIVLDGGVALKNLARNN